MTPAALLVSDVIAALRYRPLVLLAVALAVGIALVDVPVIAVGLATGLIVVASVSIKRPAHVRAAAVCLALTMVAGYWRGRAALAPGRADVSTICGQYATVCATISDEPVCRNGSASVAVDVARVAVSDGPLRPVRGRLQLSIPVARVDDAPLPGEMVRFRATITPIASAPNPYEPGRAVRLRHQGIFSQARVRRAQDWSLMRPDGAMARFRAWTAGIRRSFVRQMDSLLPSLEPALLSGILFGGRSGLPDDVADMFSATGTSHILAASGMNVAVVALLVAWLLPAHLVPRRTRTWFLLAAVATYTAAAGATPSVVRAALMVALIQIGSIMGRETDSASGVAGAALLVLLARPGDLWDPGFQMSFAIVTVFVGVAPLVREAPQESGGSPPAVRRHVRRVLNALLWPAIAMLAVAPLTAQYFGTVPLAGTAANVVVVPLVAYLVVAGLAMWPLSLLVPGAAQLLAGLALGVPVRVILGTVRVFADVPGAVVSVRPPGIGLATAYYLMLGLAVVAARRAKDGSRQSPRPTYALYALGPAWFITATFMLLAGRLQPPSALEVVFLNVGQGDATVVTGPDGEVLLVDAGRRSDDTNAGRTAVAPYLRKRASNAAEILAITHADDDHAGGAATVLELASVDWLLAPPRFYEAARLDALSPAGQAVQAASNRGVAVQSVTNGAELHWPDGLEVSVLGPVAGPQTGLQSGNDSSLVLRLTYGRRSILLTGDAGSAEEEAIMATGANVRADVLKLGHHGSHASSSAAFLDAVGPTDAVASLGSNNPYGHPSGDVVDRLSRRRIRLWRTDTQGAVVVRTDGRSLVIHASAQGY